MAKLKKTKKYPLGAVLGAVQGINAFAQPIRERAEEIDPITGKYKDFSKASRTAMVGATLNPFKAGTDPDATFLERLGGFSGFGALAQKNIYKRKQAKNMNQAFLANNPNTVNQGRNPYAMYPMGGMVPYTEPAELEDGEVFKVPGGQLQEVEGKTHAEGGELYNLPEGTAILGKNKSKEYDKKYKELGQKLKKYQDKYKKVTEDNSSTPIARRTAEIMLDRVQDDFNNLIAEQEAEKVAMNNTNQFKKGGIYIKPENRGKFNATKKRTGKTTEELTHSSNPVTRKRAIFAQNARKWKHPDGTIIDGDPNPDGGFVYKSPWQVEEPLYTAPTVNQYTINQNTTPTNPIPFANEMIAEPKNTIGLGSKVGNAFGAVAELAPTLYNLGQGMFGRDENFNYTDYLNPYLNEIRDTMRNRRYDVSPELQSNRLGQAMYNYNLRNTGASPSQLAGGLAVGSVARQRADAAAFAAANNMNNQYLSEQAQMDYQLGNDISNLKSTGYDLNLRNRAAKRNYTTTGLSQLQQYYQNKRLMANQAAIDQQRLALLPDLFANYLYNPKTGSFYFNQGGNQ